MSLITSLLAFAPATVSLPAPAPQDVLSLYMDRTEALLKHPKDKGLRTVMDLLAVRLLELPREIPKMEAIPPQLIPLIYEMAGSAKTLRIVDARETSPMIPVSLQVSLQPAKAERASEWMNTVEGMLRQAGAPLGSRDAEGFVPIEGVPMPTRLGASEGTLKLSMGEGAGGPIDLTGVELPGGVTPHFAMQMNLGTVLEMAMPFLQMEEPEVANVVMEIASATGLEDFSMTMAWGSDSQKGYMVARMPGWGALMRSKGALPVEGLTAADLALIPADCTVASMQSVDLHAMFDVALSIAEPYLAEQGFDRPLERIEEMIGVHLERDLLDHLGNHLGTYLSDSTGGGGFFSTVMFIEVKDPVKLSEGMDRISALINGAVASEFEGYVQMRKIEREGMPCHTLTFPGLPIPFEPTMVVGKNNLFIGFSPQAAVAALRQESGGSSSLMSNEEFLAGFDGNFANLYGVNFFASQAFLREGYGLTSLVCSALSNGVRSPLDTTRDAGLVLPTFHELTQGVRATVGTMRLEANGDIVSRVESDPSMLVGLTRGIGYLTSNPGMLLALAPALMGSVMPYNTFEAPYTSEW